MINSVELKPSSYKRLGGIFILKRGGNMSKKEIEEQIVKCKELQCNCKVDDIDAFLRLSKRIEELVVLLEQLIQKDEPQIIKSENKSEEYF